MKKTEKPAPVEYDERLARSRQLVKALSGALDRHQKKQSTNVGDWGYPSDLWHVNNQLEEILKFLVPNK